MSRRAGQVRLVNEFEVNELGQLDLFGPDPRPPGVADEISDEDLIMAGWDPADHGDPATDPDVDDETWLASLPADVRAEVEARPVETVAAWESPAAARASFADGGWCDTMPPGSLLAELLAEATVEGYQQLTDDQLAGVLRAQHRQIAYEQAGLAVAVQQLAGRRAAGSSRAARHLADELAIELTLTGRSAGRLVDVCDGLDRLPGVATALRSGSIDWVRACVFIDELAVLGDAAARDIADLLAGPAAAWTTGQLRAALVRAVLAADPAAAGRRQKQARKETRVEVYGEASGNAALSGRELRPSDVIVMDAKLSADADWLRGCGVPGTKDQLRSLAYTTLLSGRELASILDDPSCWPRDPNADGAAADSDGPEERDAAGAGAGTAGAAGRDPGGPVQAAGSIHLTMPLSALAGLTEAAGEVAGHGPIDAATSRELAANLSQDARTRWCLTVTGPDGRPVGHACAPVGPAAGEPVITWAAGLRDKLESFQRGSCDHARQAPGYVPPRRLAHLVRIRQRTCAAPGCRRAAVRCDLDHTHPYEKGGISCECNLAPVCRRHHRCKQAPGWHLTQDQPGVMTWRLPSGRTYTTTGDPYPDWPVTSTAW